MAGINQEQKDQNNFPRHKVNTCFQYAAKTMSFTRVASVGEISVQKCHPVVAASDSDNNLQLWAEPFGSRSRQVPEKFYTETSR